MCITHAETGQDITLRRDETSRGDGKRHHAETGHEITPRRDETWLGLMSGLRGQPPGAMPSEIREVIQEPPQCGPIVHSQARGDRILMVGLSRTDTFPQSIQ